MFSSLAKWLTPARANALQALLGIVLLGVGVSQILDVWYALATSGGLLLGLSLVAELVARRQK